VQKSRVVPPTFDWAVKMDAKPIWCRHALKVKAVAALVATVHLFLEVHVGVRGAGGCNAARLDLGAIREAKDVAGWSAFPVDCGGVFL